MRSLLLLLALSTAAAQKSDLGINSNYDRFKDETVYSVTEWLMPDRPGYVLLSALVIFKGNQPKRERPKTAFLQIESNTDDWYFLNTSNVLRVIEDGERFEIGKMERVDSAVNRSSVTEWLLVQVPFSTIERLSQGKKVELQVGRYEVELKPSAIQNL